MRFVFINGWAASEKLLNSFKACLPESIELFVLDDLYGLEQDALFAKLDQNLATNTVLIGWSLGGMLALLYLSYLTERKKDCSYIIGSVLLNVSPRFLEAQDWPSGVSKCDFDKLKLVVDKQKSDELVRLFSHLLVAGSDSVKHDRRFIKPLFNSSSLPDFNVLSRGLLYLELLDLRSSLSRIDLPILSIMGGKDALMNRAIQLEKSRVSENYHLEVFQNMGHFPFGAYADQVSQVIIKFINDCSKT